MHLKASKYLSHAILVTPAEMEALLSSIPPYHLYNVSSVTTQPKIDAAEFLRCYGDYFESMQITKEVRSFFSSALSSSEEAFTTIETSNGMLLRAVAPVVQLRAHSFTCQDGVFRSQVFGKNAKPWGIQFSYPQIYEAPTGEIIEVYKDKEYPNTKLFRALISWVRANTKPMSFMIEGEKKTATFRIGKKVDGTRFDWK